MANVDNINWSGSLVSTQNLVESPFIIAKIGDYTFGSCGSTSYANRLQETYNITFPNFMKNINITKVNGALNTYTLEMTYAITPVDDPNMLEKIFSSVSNSRKITLSYGDWNVPGYIYKNEEAIITGLSTDISFKDAKITYRLKCTSTALSLTAGVQSFSKYGYKKPSEVIKTLLENTQLVSIFTGMTDPNVWDELIAGDDLAVEIQAKQSITIFDYISYLVSCMTYVDDFKQDMKRSIYTWHICDDIDKKYGGPYFRVDRVTSNPTSLESYDVYEVDIGYPNGSHVMEFSIKNDDSWSILYQYAEKVQLPKYTYTIDNEGKLVSGYSPMLTNSSKYYKTTQQDRDWWSQVTQFPVQASLTIKGLLRPAMLMNYVKVNTFFYGKRHISSGTYIITKQEDSISGNGYRTVLSLTRVKADDTTFGV